jgi:hypothetical protein
MNKVLPEPNSGCWLWTAVVSNDGYGQFGVGNRATGFRMAKAHRVSYELFVGPIPEGLQLDHLCRVRCCVNPRHLEPVNNRENALRGTRLKQHCPKGHEYSGANLYVNPNTGHRFCKQCMAVAAEKYRVANREAIRIRNRKGYVAA